MKKFKPQSIKFFNKNFILLPTPINISIWWNFGSLLGFSMIVQIISGILLSMNYCPSTNKAFESMIHIIQNVNYGWLLHNIHLNGASMFFICMYIHMSRSIYYNSFKLSKKKTWMMGVTIFIISMTTAFLGYVLPWGQMSFWGATVITNLMSTVPYIGLTLTQWVWGGFSINNSTLNRFFSIHFVLPLIMSLMVLMHLMFLHETGSSNPLGSSSNLYKIPFHIYFTIKDILGMWIMFSLFIIIILEYPYIFSDPENFITANPMITPPHIQPEWYFLFAYAILRSIPNKLGGVMALSMSILILYFLPLLIKMKWNSSLMYPINQIMFWTFINIFMILTMLGCQPIENPFIQISQIMTILYFSFFIINKYLIKIWEFIMS